MAKKLNSNGEEHEPSSLEFLLNGVDIENRIIDIRSVIDENVASVVIRALMVMASKSDKEPINILLSSPGGSVYDGLAIYEYLNACPCPIHIQASGLVASMGFIIYLAGDVRTATPYTTFMMHSVAYISGSDSKIVRHHEIEAAEGKRINGVLLDIMGTRTNRNRKYWYRTVSLVDRYFTVQEALDIGVIKEYTKPVRRKKTRKVVK